MSKRKPTPKTQQEIMNDMITPYELSNQGKPPVSPSFNRGNEISAKGSDVKDFSVGLEDMDSALMFYFDNVIKPMVVQNDQYIKVPIIYGSPERWKAVQRDGYYRDKDGKLMAPLIMFKRESIEKVRDIGNKLDANNPHNFQVFEKKYTQRNQYDNFSQLSNRKPVKELHGVIIPDYVNIIYKCIVFTNYVDHMNKIIESINFASDSFWGDKERFQFRTKIDTFGTQTQLETGNDRSTKSEFTIKLYGYIIPDTINKDMVNIGKFFSKSRVTFTMETSTGDTENEVN